MEDLDLHEINWLDEGTFRNNAGDKLFSYLYVRALIQQINRRLQLIINMIDMLFRSREKLGDSGSEFENEAYIKSRAKWGRNAKVLNKNE